MKVFLTFLLTMILFAGIRVHAQTSQSYEELFKELNTTLDKRDYYMQQKFNQLTRIKQRLVRSIDPLEKFKACKALFHKYYDLQIDSALHYAEQMLILSENELQGYEDKRKEAILCIAQTYSYTGMYKECEELLHSEFPSAVTLSNPIKQLYYKVNLELHRGLKEHVSIEKEIKSYKKKIKADIDSLLSCVPKHSLWHAIYSSTKLKGKGNHDEALAVLYRAFNQMSTDDREMAQLAFFISDVHRIKGDKEAEKIYLTLSSITDIKHAVKEYVSLWKLATLLYDEGNIDVAFRFVEISLQDATYSGAYRWILQITKMLPRIYEAYNTKIIYQRNAILAGFLIITLLLVGIIWQFKRLRNNKRQLSRINEELKLLNKELNVVSETVHVSNVKLEIANSQLLFLNNELISASLLKETYLTKFIDQCSDYIDKLDDYRRNLKRLFKGGNTDKIQKELDSKTYIESEYRTFILNFDETFLKLYPNFVDEFNNLFPEEEKQEIKKNELLTTELRIYALIRLGITDSNQIARFLRCSISTIYTYRSKIKNRSFCPELFEDTIRDFHKDQYVTPPEVLT